MKLIFHNIVENYNCTVLKKGNVFVIVHLFVLFYFVSFPVSLLKEKYWYVHLVIHIFTCLNDYFFLSFGIIKEQAHDSITLSNKRERESSRIPTDIWVAQSKRKITLLFAVCRWWYHIKVEEIIVCIDKSQLVMRIAGAKGPWGFWWILNVLHVWMFPKLWNCFKFWKKIILIANY